MTRKIGLMFDIYCSITPLTLQNLQLILKRFTGYFLTVASLINLLLGLSVVCQCIYEVTVFAYSFLAPTECRSRTLIRVVCFFFYTSHRWPKLTLHCVLHVKISN